MQNERRGRDWLRRDPLGHDRRGGWQRFGRAALYPGVLGASLIAAAWLARGGAAARAVAAPAPVLVAALVIFLVEREWPLHREWQPAAGVRRVDLAHALFSSAAVSAVVKAAALGLVVQLAGALGAVGASPWPMQWPMAAQLLVALLVSELGSYWVHRICHGSAFAWRVHALHHTSTEMHVLAPGRNHPFNVILTYGLEVLPVALAGAPAGVLALLGVFTAVNGLLKHANVDMRLGPLNYFFSGPELHRWHHATDVAQSSTNFGNNLLVWDHLFGSFFQARGERAGVAVGIAEVAAPTSYFAQLALPFRYGRVARLEK